MGTEGKVGGRLLTHVVWQSPASSSEAGWGGEGGTHEPSTRAGGGGGGFFHPGPASRPAWPAELF